MRGFLGLRSIENDSVIRKFSVVFSLISLFPFLALTVLFFLFVWSPSIKMNYDFFFWAVFLAGVFSFLGFFIMRRTLVNLIRVSKGAQEIIKKGDLSQRIDLKAAGDNEVSQLARTFNEVVQQLENNIRQLEKSKSMVQDVLVRVASGASSAENIEAYLNLILETTANAFDGSCGLLLIFDEAKEELAVKSSYGLADAYPKDKRIPLAEEGVVSWVIKQRKPLIIPRMHKLSEAPVDLTAFAPPLICAPLLFQNRVMGAICISGRKHGDSFQEDELILLSNLAAQVAFAIENSRLNADNQKAYFETITALALAVEARDIYSRGHSDRVGEYAVKIAKELNLSAEQIKTVKEAAQLHDVGKIGMSDDILRKPGILNDFESDIMKQHPIIGEGIIVPLHGFAHLRGPIRHHHEWLNGEGYPDHLKAEQISLEARILAVADSFDAMTTDRPYRKALDFPQAKEELLKYKDIRYDGKVIEAFIKCMHL